MEISLLLNKSIVKIMQFSAFQPCIGGRAGMVMVIAYKYLILSFDVVFLAGVQLRVSWSYDVHTFNRI